MVPALDIGLLGFCDGSLLSSHTDADEEFLNNQLELLHGIQSVHEAVQQKAEVQRTAHDELQNWKVQHHDELNAALRALNKKRKSPMGPQQQKKARR